MRPISAPGPATRFRRMRRSAALRAQATGVLAQNVNAVTGGVLADFGAAVSKLNLLDAKLAEEDED